MPACLPASTWRLHRRHRHSTTMLGLPPPLMKSKPPSRLGFAAAASRGAFCSCFFLCWRFQLPHPDRWCVTVSSPFPHLRLWGLLRMHIEARARLRDRAGVVPAYGSSRASTGPDEHVAGAGRAGLEPHGAARPLQAPPFSTRPDFSEISFRFCMIFLLITRPIDGFVAICR